MSPEQCRAARGWLHWSQTDLGRRARVSLSTVRDFENRNLDTQHDNIEAMQNALEQAGLEFIFRDGKPAGIMLAPEKKPA